MKKRIIAGRYADALLKVAKKNGEMDRIFDETVYLKKILTENPSVRRFLESPHITQEDKTAFVKRVFSTILSRTYMNFLLLLLNKYRLQLLTDITDEYQILYDIEKSIQRADVITGYPLSSAMAERLYSTIERIMQKSLKLCFYVDPEIIGGVIIKTPNRILDGSIRKQLRDLGQAITSTRV